MSVRIRKEIQKLLYEKRSGERTVIPSGSRLQTDPIDGKMTVEQSAVIFLR